MYAVVTACARHSHSVYPLAGVQKKLGLKNVGGFAVSQNPGSPQLAAYVPEGKGSPGYVGVWPLSQLSKTETPPPTARRSFFRVSIPASPHCAKPSLAMQRCDQSMLRASLQLLAWQAACFTGSASRIVHSSRE